MSPSVPPSVLLLLAGLLSCAPSLPHPPSVGPLQNPADLLAQISSQTAGLKDQKAHARVDLTIDGVKERRTTAHLLYRYPKHLKIDVGTFGVVVLSALSTDDTLRVHLPRENHYLEGTPEDVLYSITGVDLKYYSVDRAILGLPTLQPSDLPRIVNYRIDRERIFVEVNDPLWTRRVWVDKRTATVREEQILDKKNGRLSSRWLSDFRVENGVILPRSIEIRQGEDVIRIQYKRRQINTGLSPNAFQMRVPADVIRHTRNLP